MPIDRSWNRSEGSLQADGSDSPGELASLSEMLDALGRQSRRRVLLALLREDEPVSVESLARMVAAKDASPGADGGERIDGEGTGA
ncbi:hypothetical protein [Haloarchaeobius baliensis]|uniref:hypothetical protein n=1 Tax=Haloarchaeobius baliensis TaxID=1670458 RepID=UPI003F8846E1